MNALTINHANDFAFAVELLFAIIALLVGMCLLTIVFSAIVNAIDRAVQRRQYNKGVWRISGNHLERPEEKWRKRK